ncbi:DUF4395 domain-containing protein [Ferruginibacter lapsinanis]|uniref:DUF4395 domain-containing protein n=1 Tax=Ferruginibacter lapsinanis TaxID=563172 RepID=UPI001E5C1D8F|nr:DUF4395 domain-containing protein [Ferruginibacter lapsinanis]UEG49742.1 DUF4395 domain-containing protein [Ferruginibacter lapsinanis]
MENKAPADGVEINENIVRLNALWVFILIAFSLFFAATPIYMFLAADFFLRTFNFEKFSLINWHSKNTIQQLNIPDKPIAAEPRRFAAGIGFIVSFIILILLQLHLYKIALGCKIVFAILAFLESFAGICVGCYIYSFIRKTKTIK